MSRLILAFALLMTFTTVSARADDAAAPLFTASYSQAEAAVAQALTDKGAGTKISAAINNHKAEALFSYTQPLTVEVHGLTFDKPSGHWSANLLAMSGGNVITALPAAGHFDEMVELPVLKHQVRNGEVITAKDIEIHDFPAIHARADFVSDMENLIGKSPIHSISATRPIRELEIATPAIIKKNSLVQMHYSATGMEISTSGQALEDGAKGSVISLRNLASKKVVQATVQDATNVTVTPVSEPTVALSSNNQPDSSTVENPYAAN